MKISRYKITNALAVFRLRWSRGYGLVDFFFITPIRFFVYLGGAVVLLEYKFGIVIPDYWVIFGVGILMSVYYFGWLDEKFGFWRAENTYQQKDLTPFFEDMGKKVEELHERYVKN